MKPTTRLVRGARQLGRQRHQHAADRAVPALGGTQEGDGLALRPPAQDDLRRGLFVAVRRASADRPALSVLIEELTVRARAA